MQLISQEKRLQQMIRLFFSSLLLVSATGYASTVINDHSGVRIVGRVTDGSVMLDGSSSELTGLEIPSLITRASAQYPSASELVAIGRVDSLDLSSNTVTVAGQTAAIGENTRLIDALHGTSRLLIATVETNQPLKAGDHVAIAGDITGPGQAIARFVVLMASAATPGTSLVYVRGVVGGMDPIGGSVSIGQVKLDLSVSSNRNNFDNLLVGDIVEAVGYSIGPGELAVTDFSKITSFETKSADTPTTQGIHGISLKGIHGSGAKASLKGIHGSGAKASLKGIHGSGAKASLKGIHGSGAKASLKGIHGSGAKAK